jgi:hypothetical protein
MEGVIQMMQTGKDIFWQISNSGGKLIFHERQPYKSCEKDTKAAKQLGTG